MKIIAVTGGIGAGKSIVCDMLRALGHDVYDCDSHAKGIMDGSDIIKHVIADEICAAAVVDGVIDRKVLAEVVFSDKAMLDRLNRAVHSAVRDDIVSWAEGRPVAFVETAILYQSGLDRIVDEVWNVVAPQQLRINRVMMRNGFERDQVVRRVEAQDGFVPDCVHPRVFDLVNDDVQPLLPQLEARLNVLQTYSR